MIANPFHPAKFISFEGIDGSVKSEQFTRVKHFLRAYRKDIKWKETKEPTDQPLGQEIYQILLGTHPTVSLENIHPHDFQELYYFQDRIWDYKHRIIPDLNSGWHVLVDRGPVSVVFGAEDDRDLGPLMEKQEQTFSKANTQFIWPDLILIYDVDIDIAIHRLKKKGRKLDKFEEREKLQRVRENYLAFAKMYENCVVINGNLGENEVFMQAKPHIFHCLDINGD